MTVIFSVLPSSRNTLQVSIHEKPAKSEAAAELPYFIFDGVLYPVKQEVAQ